MRTAARPLAALLLLALLPLAGGCAVEEIPGDTPQRQLVREATAVNQTAKAAYAAVRRAHRVGLIDDRRLVSLEPYIDAVEAGRRELTRVAQAGESERFPAVLSALNEALGELAVAQLEAEAVEAAKRRAPKPATRPARALAPLDSEPALPPIP